MNFDAITQQHIATVARFDKLDDALRPLMDLLDPEHKHDLGGSAGVWWSGGEFRWPTWSHTHRTIELQAWLRYERNWRQASQSEDRDAHERLRLLLAQMDELAANQMDHLPRILARTFHGATDLIRGIVEELEDED